MDDNVRLVFIAALPVIGGVIVGVLVAKITADRSRQLERERWKRELYASFIHSTNEIRDAIRLIATGPGPEDGWAANSELAQRALLEIKMTAPTMSAIADRVWTAAAALMHGVLRFEAAAEAPGGAQVPIDLTNYAGLDEGYRLAMLAFIAQATKELG